MPISIDGVNVPPDESFQVEQSDRGQLTNAVTQSACQVVRNLLTVIGVLACVDERDIPVGRLKQNCIGLADVEEHDLEPLFTWLLEYWRRSLRFQTFECLGRRADEQENQRGECCDLQGA